MTYNKGYFFPSCPFKLNKYLTDLTFSQNWKADLFLKQNFWKETCLSLIHLPPTVTFPPSFLPSLQYFGQHSWKAGCS